jgi:hypothetical protein
MLGLDPNVMLGLDPSICDRTVFGSRWQCRPPADLWGKQRSIRKNAVTKAAISLSNNEPPKRVKLSWVLPRHGQQATCGGTPLVRMAGSRPAVTGQEQVNVAVVCFRTTHSTGDHLMAAMGYPMRRIRTRRPSMIELALAVSVIAGLAFVSLRVKNMTPAESPAQTVEQTVAVVKADAVPLAPDTTGSKTP